MTFDTFITKWNGKGVDYDGWYGYQCMDLYRQYVKEVVVAKQSSPVRGAKDVWNNYNQVAFERISNQPTNFPQKGDIVIWGVGVGQYGHIAICITADSYKLTSFDQNWPVGTLCHKQPHNYTGVLGWLRPKKKELIEPEPAEPQETPPIPEATPEPIPTPEEVPTNGTDTESVVSSDFTSGSWIDAPSGDTTRGMDSSINPFDGTTPTTQPEAYQEVPIGQLPPNSIIDRLVAWLVGLVRGWMK